MTRNTTWTHKDALRLGHPKIPAHLAAFALGKDVIRTRELRPGDLIDGFEKAQAAKTEKDALAVLAEYKNLPWEVLPTHLHTSVDVWKAIFYNGQLRGQALVRNITRLAKMGAFSDMKFAGDYAAALTDEDMIRKTRLHPVNLLNASVVYAEGQRERGGMSWYGSGRTKTWQTEGVIADALDKAFHLSFKTIEPAGKRTLIGLDVSGSMSTDAMGLDLSCAQVGAAVAMTIARTEPYYKVMGFSTQFVDLGITPNQSFSTILGKTRSMNFGGTDCALPMVWAQKNNIEVDTFVTITDSETWYGSVHPHKALENYRQAMGIPARLAVLGVAGSPFTIADKDDSGSMDFCGFDSSGPAVLADFSAGRL